MRESTTGGKPANRKSQLEHRWTFNVTGGDSVVLDATAWRTNNNEGDDFTFAYSTNGTSYTDMFTVNTNSSQSYSYELPSTTSGTLYVRVVDTDRTQGNNVKDEVSVDYLAITNSSGSSTPTPEPTPTDPPPTATPTDEPPTPTATTPPPTATPTDPPPPTATPTDEPPTPTATTPPPTATPTDEPPTPTATTPPPTATPTDVPPTPTATTTPPSGSTDLVSSEYAVDGNLSVGSYVDTRIDDGVAEKVLERSSGGKPSNRTSFIDYRWQINVLGTGDLTLVADAWADANSEGDIFSLGYSTDGVNFTTMFDLGTAEQTQTYQLPSGISGTLTIRVTDSDQTKGNSNRDGVYIDYLAVVSSGGGRDVSMIARPAELAVADARPVTQTSTITYPLFYTGDGKLISSLAFVLELDAGLVGLDSADSNTDNVIDGLTFNLPAGFSATATAAPQGTTTQLAFNIAADDGAEILSDGSFGSLTFTISSDAPTDEFIPIEFVDGSVELRDDAAQPLAINVDSGSLYVVPESPTVPTAIVLSVNETSMLNSAMLLWFALLASISLVLVSRRLEKQA